MRSKEEVHKRLALFLKNEEDKLELIATFLGFGAVLSDFIYKHRDFVKITDDVAYGMTIFIHNIKAFMCDAELEMGVTPDYNLPTNEKLLNILRMIIEVYKDEL